MCKIMMMNAIKPDKVEKALAFSKVMGKLMTFSNKDGLGYAAIDSYGNLFGERWLYNDTAWQHTQPAAPPREPAPRLSDSESRVLTAFPGLTKVAPHKQPPQQPAPKFEYNSFGDINLGDMRAITLHTRFSTNKVCMENTHPFVEDETALIHNGVINNVKDFKLTLSTCDSETILISYLKNQVWKKPSNMKDVAKSLEGYYACAVLSVDKEGKNIMDIFRANGASLHICYVHDLDTYVFSTSETDIKEACKLLKFTHDDPYEFNDEHFVRLNAMTGEMIAIAKFKPAARWNSYPHTHYNNWEEYSHDKYDRHDKVVGINKKDNLTPAMVAYMKAQPEIHYVGTVEDIKEVVNE